MPDIIKESEKQTLFALKSCIIIIAPGYSHEKKEAWREYHRKKIESG